MNKNELVNEIEKKLAREYANTCEVKFNGNELEIKFAFNGEYLPANELLFYKDRDNYLRAIHRNTAHKYLKVSKDKLFKFSLF